MDNMPIKRAEEIKGVSHDHHHALRLVLKINKGISLDISPDRISCYVQWFRKNHMVPHFKIEEEWMFPILGNHNKKVQQALDEHIYLLKAANTANNHTDLQAFATALKNHIRFEERDLFQDIQEVATQEQLNDIGKTPYRRYICRKQYRCILEMNKLVSFG